MSLLDFIDKHYVSLCIFGAVAGIVLFVLVDTYLVTALRIWKGRQ